MSITFEELNTYKHNTGMEATDRFLPELMEAVKLYPDTLAERAAKVMSLWDKKTDTNSKGAVLFAK